MDLVKKLKRFMHGSGKNKVVLGLSGGIDSALCLKLAVLTLGKENVTAIFMPELGLTKDSNKEDALNLANDLNVKIEIVPINPYLRHIRELVWDQTELSIMNMKPRIRMIILYNYANANDAIVIGTSNKSEIYLGYGTKYGDTASDVLPIGNIYKTDVFMLARELCIPQSIIDKQPSAELIEGQTDESEMGITYETADKILAAYLDDGLSKDELIHKFKKYDVETVLLRISKHEHKRNMPRVL